jgi:lysophospholipase L1-like esterase
MNPRYLLLAATSAALIGSPAHADILASYGFAGSNNTQRAAPTTAAANLTAGSFSFNSALINSNTGFSIAADGNLFARVNGTSATNLTDAITGNQYVTVTITPNSGFLLNLTHLTVGLGYSLAAANVPAGVGVELGAALFSSVDGFTAEQVLAARTFTAADTTSEPGTVLYQNINIDLTGAAYQGLTGPLEFRIYFYDSTNTPTQPIHRVDNFTLNGAVAAPPGTPLSVKEISVDAASKVHLLLSGTPGSPYRVYRSNDLEGPLYRKRWSERFAGAFPAGISEVPLSEPMGTEPRGFFVATASEPRARILCLGDSITEGNSTMVVYKGPLYDKLTAAGYRFEYVGSKSSAYTSPTYGALTLKHEGYSGKNCTEIAGFFATNSPLYPADIVIIHAAHNLNIAEAVLTPTQEAAIVTTVENATRAMIQTARDTHPAVKILLAKVITSGKLPKYSYIPAVNVRLGEIAAELNTPAQPVISVDQAAGFDWTTDTVTDKVHPNAAGGEKMARKFFDALVPLLE